MSAARRLIPLLTLTALTAGVLTTVAGPAPAAETGPFPNYRVSNDKWVAHSEPHVAQDPTNPEILIGASKMFNTLQGGPGGYRFKIGTYRSEDGGKTWEDQGMLGGDDPNNSWAAQGYQNTTDPVVQFDSSGNAYAQILVYRGTGQDVPVSGLAGQNKIVVYKSTDKGKTWGTPVDVAHIPPGASIVHSADKNWLTVDTSGGKFDGFMYSTWTYTEVPAGVATQNIYFSASYDGGSTWTRPHRILSTTVSQLKQTSTPVVGPDGTIYVTYHNYVNHVLYMTKSSDAGATWTLPTVVANIVPPASTLNGNVRSGPLVISVPTVLPNNKILVVWNDASNDGGDIYMASSTDGGSTWSSPATVNQVTDGDQVQPWITTTDAGTVWAMWLDRRDDPQNMKFHVYAARSTDGGETWTEYRATDVASDPRVGLPLDRGNRGFYGDYQGLVADDQTGAQILFNETRVGSQELFFVRVNPNETTVAATAAGGSVQVSGRAGFRGRINPPVTEEDGTADAPVPAPGLDLTGARVYQPDPYVPRLVFEFHATDLLEPRGSTPEAIRYLWNFRTVAGGGDMNNMLLQAKLSNVASVTMADEQQGHIGSIGAAFQLRKNCVGNYPQPPVPLANCPHAAWLKGHFDLVNNIVRVYLPIGQSFTQNVVPGAVLLPSTYAGGEIYSSPQAVASQATVYDMIDWQDENAYRVPVREAFVGIADPGTPADEVAYSPLPLGAGDSFQASLPGAAGQSVYVKTCFDGRCDVTTASVS